jgi:hypothetical protein
MLQTMVEIKLLPYSRPGDFAESEGFACFEYLRDSGYSRSLTPYHLFLFIRNEPTNNSEMQLERINCLNMILMLCWKVDCQHQIFQS